MHRLFQLTVVLLPLALGAASVRAQEPSPPGAAAPHPSAHPPPGARPLSGQGAMSERWRRDPAPAPAPLRLEPRGAPSASQDSRMSDAVRRVQRSTQGQILGAEQVPFEGRNITRVKYMDSSGRVRYMDDPGAAERRPPQPQRADNGQP